MLKIEVREVKSVKHWSVGCDYECGDSTEMWEIVFADNDLPAVNTVYENPNFHCLGDWGTSCGRH